MPHVITRIKRARQHNRNCRHGRTLHQLALEGSVNAAIKLNKLVASPDNDLRCQDIHPELTVEQLYQLPRVAKARS